MMSLVPASSTVQALVARAAPLRAVLVVLNRGRRRVPVGGAGRGARANVALGVFAGICVERLHRGRASACATAVRRSLHLLLVSTLLLLGGGIRRGGESEFRHGHDPGSITLTRRHLRDGTLGPSSGWGAGRQNLGLAQDCRCARRLDAGSARSLQHGRRLLGMVLVRKVARLRSWARYAVPVAAVAVRRARTWPLRVQGNITLVKVIPLLERVVATRLQRWRRAWVAEVR